MFRAMTVTVCCQKQCTVTMLTETIYNHKKPQVMDEFSPC